MSLSKPSSRKDRDDDDEEKQRQSHRYFLFQSKRALLIVEPRYVVEEIVGAGAYGIVCSAVDLRSKQPCCIKKIEKAAERRGIATRTLRELILLRHFSSEAFENIVHLQRVMIPRSPNITDVYVVFELMETDLGCVIRSQQELSDDHIQFFIYQLIRAVKYMHSAGVVHRDLKPRNLLVNSNCDLKVCDFGLARFLHPDHPQALDHVIMSDYVATRWYRAPEIVLRIPNCGPNGIAYGKPVDMWSVGVILAELIMRKPLFPAHNEMELVDMFQKVLGIPNVKNAILARPDGSKSRRKHGLPRSDSKASMNGASPSRSRRNGAQNLPFSETLKEYVRKQTHGQPNPLALDLMAKCMALRPEDRLDAVQALQHEYLRELHEPADEPLCKPPPDHMFAFELKRTSVKDLRALIHNEIVLHYPPDKVVYQREPRCQYVPDDRKRPKIKRRNSHH